MPEQIINFDGKELLKIDKDISVSEYEEINPDSKICMVFMNNNPMFPYSTLNLKNKMIIVNKIRME